MANILYIPDLNPLKYVDMSPTELPQYLSRDFLDYRFHEIQHDWDQYVLYYQKFQTSDIIYQQFTSNFDPIQIDLVDCEGNVHITQTALQKRAHKYLIGYFIYEDAISLAGIAPGVYFVKVTAGGKICVCEPILIAVTHPGTIRHDYKNSRYHGDVIFETGIEFALRVEATKGFLNPGSQDVIYTDQKFNPSLLSSKTYRSIPLHYGGSEGLPDWMVDKLNKIWSCNSVLADGKSYAKKSDAKYAFKEEENYPMRGMTLEVQEGINRGSKIISAELDPNKRLAIIYNLDVMVFGDIANQASSNLVPIITVE